MPIRTKTIPDLIDAPTIQAIEDAILFGHIKEIDAVLESVREDVDFPDVLRHGLEALRHFRAYYGKNGVIEPSQWLQKQKVAVVENAWGAELLDMLKSNEERIEKRA